MALILDNDTGLTLIKPDWPDCPSNVQAFSSTRIGGVSLAPYGDISGDAGLNLGDHVGDLDESVHLNRACIAEYMPQPVTFLSQIHGNIAVNLAEHSHANPVRADACYTNLPNQTCVVLTADCLPILLASLDGKYVAAIHAGWRGLAHGVIQNTLQELRLKTDAEFTAWFGPAIGSDAFEVGQEVLDQFVQQSNEYRTCFKPAKVNGKFLADIFALARHVLHRCGVQRIHGGRYCTYEDETLFYSYRRDGVTGRMASWIWLE